MIAGVIACAWAALYTGALTTAIGRACLRRRATAIDTRPLGHDVVLLRPCAGAEPGLVDRLAQDGGARRIVLAVGSLEDGATTAALAAAADLRRLHLEAEVVATGARGPNHKADQLGRALGRCSPPPRVVVVADSDVVLGDDAVRRLVSELAASGYAAIWAPPALSTAARGTLASSVLEGSLHAFPLLAGMDASGFVGKLFAIRLDALAAVGGFPALVDVLGEDMELARRLRGRGLTTAPSRSFARSTRRLEARELVTRLERWILVIRAQRPHLLPSYPLLIAAGPLALALAVAGAIAGDRLVFVAALIGLVGRAVVALVGPWIVHATIPSPVEPLRALVADALVLVAFVRALATRDVVWRGRRLRLEPGGRLVGSPDEPCEHAFGGAREHAGPGVQVDDEAVRTPPGEGVIDASKLRGDPRALSLEPVLHVTRNRIGRADRDPRLGSLAAREDVPDADGDDLRVARDAGHRRRAGLELQRLERRALAALRVDPHESPRTHEQARGMPDRAGSVGRVREVDSERADPAEEREASEVRRIHHRERVARYHDVREPQRHERIPPGSVVRDDEHGAFGACRAELVGSRHEHATECACDARPRVPREERGEPAALPRRDHGRAPR